MSSSTSLASMSMSPIPSLPRIATCSYRHPASIPPAPTPKDIHQQHQRPRWSDQPPPPLAPPLAPPSDKSHAAVDPSRPTRRDKLAQPSVPTVTEHINELQSRIHNLTPQLHLYRSLLSSLAHTLSPALQSHPLTRPNHAADHDLARLRLIALIHLATASLNLKGTQSALAHESGIHLSTLATNRSALASLLSARAFPAATSLVQSVVPKDQSAPVVEWIQYLHMMHVYGRSPTTPGGGGCGREASLDWIDRHVKSARVRSVLRDELAGAGAPSGVNRECTLACQRMWDAVARLICGDPLGQLDSWTLDAAPVVARFFGDPLSVLTRELPPDQCELWPLALMGAKRAQHGLQEAGFSAPAPPPPPLIEPQKRRRHRSRSRRRSKTPSRQRTLSSDESAATPKATRNSQPQPPVPPMPDAYRVQEQQQQEAKPCQPNERKDSAIAMDSDPPQPPPPPTSLSIRQFTSQPITTTIATAPNRPSIPRSIAASSSASSLHPPPSANSFSILPARTSTQPISPSPQQPLPPSLMPRRPPGSAARPPVAASRLIRRSGMRNLVVRESTSTDSLPAPVAPVPPVAPPVPPPPLMPPPLDFESAADPPPEWNSLGTSTNGTMDVAVEQVVGVFPGSIRLLDVADYDGQPLICFTTATPDSSSPTPPDRRIHILLNHTPHARLALPTYHHKSLLTYLRFLGPTRPHSEWLVAADSDADIHLWHWPSGQRTTWRKWHKRVVYQVAGFPGRAEGGRAVLVSCAADHAVKVWGVASVPGETSAGGGGSGGGGGGEASSARSGRRKSIGGGSATSLPAADSVASVHSNAPFYAFCFAGSSTETQVLIAAQAYTLRVYKARTLALMHTFHLDHHKLNKLSVSSLLTLPPLPSTPSTDAPPPPVPNSSSTSTAAPIDPLALPAASSTASPDSLTSILVTAANGTHIRLFHPSLNAFSRAFAARELDASASSSLSGTVSPASAASLQSNTPAVARHPAVSPCGSLVVAPGATGAADRRVVVWRAASGRAVNLVTRAAGAARGKEAGVFGGGSGAAGGVREVGVGPVAWEKGGEGRVVGVVVGIGEEGGGAGGKAVRCALCVWRVGK